MKRALDNGKIAYRVFLGLQKACLDHDYQILIAKLEHYGILEIPLNLFNSYLTKCYQFVEINNVQSEMLFIECGIPQGSVLVPLLFLIQI